MKTFLANQQLVVVVALEWEIAMLLIGNPLAGCFYF